MGADVYGGEEEVGERGSRREGARGGKRREGWVMIIYRLALRAATRLQAAG